MYKLTAKRREQALPILERYRKQMEGSGRIDCGGFEKELRDCWGIGYQTLKDLVLELSKVPEYERAAAYYMQHRNAPGPVVEFQPRLAELYGAKRHESDYEEKQEAYWARGR